MPAATMDDLLALTRKRGTRDTFPEPDELDALLDPFRALPDQEMVRLALIAAVRKSGRLPARVAAQALACLGGDAGLTALLAIAADENLGLDQRAAAAWAVSGGVKGSAHELLPEEAYLCTSLAVLEMVSDPEADGGFGLDNFLRSYTTFPAQDRLPFVRTLAGLAREHGKGIATICIHLLKAETAPDARQALIDMAAAEGSQVAADLLASFAASATGADARLARRHLHILRSRGVRGQVRADLEATRAFVTGVDGDACLAVNIIIPRAPTFDLANLLLHLGSGIRDGFVRRNLSRSGVDELVDQIKGKFELTAFVPMPLCARMVDEALALARPETLAEADIAQAIALATPALEIARRQPTPAPAPAAGPAVPIERIKALLDSAGFEYWFFEAREAAIRASVEVLRKSARGKTGRPSPAAFRKRLIQESARTCERLIATGELVRLERMLRYQANALANAGHSDRAALCQKLAHELSRSDGSFLQCMATASLLRALATPEEVIEDRFQEARATLRARLLVDEPGRPHERRKKDVAVLDLATAAFLALNTVNREVPSSQRASLNHVESAALEAGKVFAATFTRGVGGTSKPAEMHALLVGILKKHALFEPSERGNLAVGLMRSVTEFSSEICGEQCPHQCFEDPTDDGRALFHLDIIPWDVDGDLMS